MSTTSTTTTSPSQRPSPRPMPSAISQSTHKEVESFWTEVQHLEKQLNDHETLKRQARKITLKDSHSDQLRLSLLEIYDDLLTSDALHHLPAKNLDDRLWNAVFYSRIEELRSVIGKFRMDGNEGLGNALEELGRCLDLAIAFYQTFILSLSSRLGYDPIAIGVDMLMTNRPKSLTKADMLKDIRFNILHKSIIFLGDIARYRAMYIPMDGVTLDPDFIYRQAVKVNPSHGKPHSQLAILATSKKEYLNVVYWYSLSLSNNIPFPVALKNLLVFHSRTTSRFSDDPTVTDMEGLSRLFIRYHRDVVFPDDASLATLDAGASVLKWGSVLEKAFRVCVWDDKRVVKEKVDMVSRMVVILLVGVTSLGEKFKKTDVTQFRQKIRYLQISILSLLLSIATECMTLVLQHMSDQAERGEYLFASTEEGELDPVFMYLRPVGTFCAWLSCGLDSFTTFQNYTAKGTILEGLNLYLWSFARALANFVNFLSAFADMDGSSECLPEDLDLLGVGIFQGFVKRLTEMSVVREVKGVGVGVEVERVSARVSRIANVAKMMSENKEVTAFFVFDEKMDARFVVLDAESKRVERDKVSKALAVEFLKNQIGSLETSLQKMKGVTVPILIPDAGCYIHNLRFIKTLLMSRSAILIIPQDVMHGLDKMKKGNDLINVRAREAIRYLEQRFKYRSPYLRAQQDEEEGDVDVGRAFRDFLRCCVYYRDRVAPRPVDEEDVTMAVVTEDMGLREVAEGAGIVVRSLRELGRRGRRR